MVSSTASSIHVFFPVSHRNLHYSGYCSCFCSPFTNPSLLVSLPAPSQISSPNYKFGTSTSNFSCRKQIGHAVEGPSSNVSEDIDDGQEYQVLTAVRSNFNHIVILDTPESRMLLLDSSHNVHSICQKGQKWTGSYWDEFVSLPAIVPQGPIAIFGLGGGTAARMMLDLWPSLELEGWEIDEILIDKAREYLGLSDLEKHTHTGGILRVCIGDALSPLVTVNGGYAGIVIDLFSDGMVLPQLQEVATWLELSEKLMPNGRFMVNCGAANDGASNAIYPEVTDSTWVQNSTIKALCKAFPGQVNWKKLSKEEGENYLALTGPLPDLNAWSTVLPDRLSLTVKQWTCCLPL